jgi:hypothetical protein
LLNKGNYNVDVSGDGYSILFGRGDEKSDENTTIADDEVLNW